MLKKQVFEYIDYGKINSKLDKFLKARDISSYELSNKTNIKFQAIQNLRENVTVRIDFEMLAKICYVLECRIEDIIEFVPPVNKDKK